MLGRSIVLGLAAMGLVACSGGAGDLEPDHHGDPAQADPGGATGAPTAGSGATEDKSPPKGGTGPGASAKTACAASLGARGTTATLSTGAANALDDFDVDCANVFFVGDAGGVGRCSVDACASTTVTLAMPARPSTARVLRVAEHEIFVSEAGEIRPQSRSIQAMHDDGSGARVVYEHPVASYPSSVNARLEVVDGEAFTSVTRWNATTTWSVLVFGAGAGSSSASGDRKGEAFGANRTAVFGFESDPMLGRLRKIVKGVQTTVVALPNWVVGHVAAGRDVVAWTGNPGPGLARSLFACPTSGTCEKPIAAGDVGSVALFADDETLYLSSGARIDTCPLATILTQGKCTRAPLTLDAGGSVVRLRADATSIYALVDRAATEDRAVVRIAK